VDKNTACLPSCIFGVLWADASLGLQAEDGPVSGGFACLAQQPPRSLRAPPGMKSPQQPTSRLHG
jgi:hypothetical protein